MKTFEEWINPDVIASENEADKLFVKHCHYAWHAQTGSCPSLSASLAPALVDTWSSESGLGN